MEFLLIGYFFVALGKRGDHSIVTAVLIMAPETAQSQTPEAAMRGQTDAPVTHTLATDNIEEPPSKKAKLDDTSTPDNDANNGATQRARGIAPVKAEYVGAGATICGGLYWLTIY